MQIAAPPQKIAIIGAGALGLYYGSLLARHEKETDTEVHFLLRSDYEAVRREGIRVRSINGDFSILFPRVHNTPQSIRVVDLCLIGLKTTANHMYGPLIEPIFRAGRTVILCLQNGIGNEDRLAQLFDSAAILGGTAFLCSNRVSPGQIEHTEYGHVAVAPYRSSFYGNVDAIVELLRRSAIDCESLENYTEMRWRKQVWNVPFNGLCTLYNQPTDLILANPDMLGRVRAIMREVIELGRAVHQAETPYLPWNLDASFIEDQVAKTRTMGAYLPSMLLDRRAGRDLEIESIVGACLETRDRLGLTLPIPEIERLYKGLCNGLSSNRQ